jgi:hypothetical protein
VRTAKHTPLRSTAGEISQEKFEADVRQVLIENGRPMKRGLLIEKLHIHGFRVGGSNEYRNFGTKIFKARDHFVNIPGEGYWPADIACPAVEYELENQLWSI